MSINTSQALPLVKARLNRMPSDTSLDSLLSLNVEAAVQRLEAQGIRLEDNASDLAMVCDLAVWLYQRRDKESGDPMWLRSMIRQRWLVQERDEHVT